MRTPKRKKSHYRPSGSIFDLPDPTPSVPETDAAIEISNEALKKPRIRKRQRIKSADDAFWNAPKSDRLDARNSAEKVSKRAVSNMIAGCVSALEVNDVNLVAKNLLLFIGLSMNGLGQSAKELGEYLIAEGRALTHPDALVEGDHLSVLAYLSSKRGLSPKLDAAHDLHMTIGKCARTKAKLRADRHRT